VVGSEADSGHGSMRLPAGCIGSVLAIQATASARFSRVAQGAPEQVGHQQHGPPGLKLEANQDRERHARRPSRRKPTPCLR